MTGIHKKNTAFRRVSRSPLVKLRRRLLAPEGCRILVVGTSKSGTSGLFFCIAHSAEKYFAVRFDRLFEPKDQQSLDGFTSRHGVAKVLSETLQKFPSPTKVFASFDKRLMIVRDPRDNVVSRLMWDIARRIDLVPPAIRAAILATLRRTEQEPDSVSLLDLFTVAVPCVMGHDHNLDDPDHRVSRGRKWAAKVRRSAYLACHLDETCRDFHRVRYEDFIDRNWSDTERYLGFALDDKFSQPQKSRRIVRTARYGDWANWFLAEDFAFFVDPERKQLAKLGYADERPEGIRRKISPAEASGYVEHLKNAPVSDYNPSLLGKLFFATDNDAP